VVFDAEAANDKSGTCESIAEGVNIDWHATEAQFKGDAKKGLHKKLFCSREHGFPWAELGL
jgi:hypothetical protein